MPYIFKDKSHRKINPSDIILATLLHYNKNKDFSIQLALKNNVLINFTRLNVVIKNVF